MKVSKMPEMIMNTARKTKTNFFFLSSFLFTTQFSSFVNKKGPKFNLNEILKKKKKKKNQHTSISKFNLFPHLLFTPYPSPGYLHPTYRSSMGTLLLFWSYGCSLGSAIFMALLTLFFSNMQNQKLETITGGCQGNN